MLFRSVAGGTELLAELLASDSAEVRSNALDGIIRRTYRSIRLEDIKVSDKGPSDLSATFKFAYPTASSEQPMRSAYTKVVASFDGVKQALDEEIPMQASGDASLNAMAVIVGPGAFSSAQADSFYATDAEFEKQIAIMEEHAERQVKQRCMKIERHNQTLKIGRAHV